MKRLIITLLCALVYGAIPAQTLVIYDARDLFPKDAWNPPCKAVFTEDYYYSEEWLNLKDRIDTYLLYQTAKENPDWIPLADEEFRQKIQEGKNMTPEGLRKAICRHAIGGRMYYSAEVLENPLFARVRNKSWEEAKSNAWGVINAGGQTIVPFRYETIGSYGNIITASRKVNPDKELWEIRLYNQDGSLASDQTYIQAFDIFNVYSQENTVCVRFSDGGWGLIDGNGRVITNKKYDEMGTGDRIFYEKDITDIWGKRDGKMYLVSPVSGRETGTFTYTFRSRENHFEGVAITWY